MYFKDPTEEEFNKCRCSSYINIFIVVGQSWGDGSDSEAASVGPRSLLRKSPAVELGAF